MLNILKNNIFLMGCLASIGAPDLLMLDAGNYEVLSEKITECNTFYKGCQSHMKLILLQERIIDERITVLLSECRSSGSFDYKLAESYIFIILFILHCSQKNEAGFEFMLSNYVPGILVNHEGLPDLLRKKYLNLKELCESLSPVLNELDKLGDLIIDDIVTARDEIPRSMLQLAKDNPSISILDFAKIERD